MWVCRGSRVRCGLYCLLFFFSSRRRHTRCGRDWSSDVCSSDLASAMTGTTRRWPGFARCPWSSREARPSPRSAGHGTGGRLPSGRRRFRFPRSRVLWGISCPARLPLETGRCRTRPPGRPPGPPRTLLVSCSPLHLRPHSDEARANPCAWHEMEVHLSALALIFRIGGLPGADREIALRERLGHQPPEVLEIADRLFIDLGDNGAPLDAGQLRQTVADHLEDRDAFGRA